MMKASNNCIELIKRHEGLRLSAYMCTSNKWTIGYGHTKGVKRTDVITKAQAEKFLDEDVKVVEGELNALKVNFTQNQFDALTAFVFNIGGQQFLTSTIRKRILVNPNDPDIHKQFQRWIYSGGEPSNGLIKRRKEEAELYFKV